MVMEDAEVSGDSDPEAPFADPPGRPDGDRFEAERQFGEYEAVSGTGQAHVWFEA